MRIALDARALTGPFTGDRTYWRNLIGALADLDAAEEHEFILYSRTPLPAEDVPNRPNFVAKLIPAPNDRIWTLITLSAALRKDRADLLHVQYTAPPKWLCPCPVVTTVHDITFRLYPEWFPPKHRLLMNLTVPISMRSARFVITDSESSRADIQRIYRLPEEKLLAIPLGLSAGFKAAEPDLAARDEAREVIKLRYGFDQPFILALGVLQPRKNLEMLASAYGKLKAVSALPHALVLVGKAGWITGREAIIKAAKAAGGEAAADSVIFPGYVPDDELPIWYRACALFAHPSLYEGFGIPPLEAMACGAAVLVSNAPALPEVVGDAGLTLPPKDPDAWAASMRDVLTDSALDDRLRSAGPRRAAAFNWSATADQTLAVYLRAGQKG